MVTSDLCSYQLTISSKVISVKVNFFTNVSNSQIVPCITLVVELECNIPRLIKTSLYVFAKYLNISKTIIKMCELHTVIDFL